MKAGFASIIQTSRRAFTTHADAIKQGYFDSAMQEIKGHAVLSHPLFSYLQTQSEAGFTPLQMRTMRDNFLCGCFETIPMLATVLTAAARRQDIRSLKSIGKNIFEETGEDQKGKDHTTLAEVSFNLHGKTFGLRGIRFSKTPHSSLITPETRLFIAGQREIFAPPSHLANPPYPLVLGATFAEEYSSNHMMKIYYDTLFKPYQGRYTEQQFSKISQYWLMHMGGMEERHAADFEQNVRDACQGKKDVEDMRKGALHVLNGQQILLTGMLTALEKAGKMGAVVPVDSPRVVPEASLDSEKIAKVSNSHQNRYNLGNKNPSSSHSK